jgi:hypothetical protein
MKMSISPISFNKDFFLWGWLFKEKEKEQYPFEFAEVTLTDVAKSKGINDDFNKVIKIYRAGEVIKEIPYSKEALESVKKVYLIPIYEEKYNAQEDFEFDTFESIGISKYKAK